jgi:two-component system heavy metal sensor histidine kinase CusS
MVRPDYFQLWDEEGTTLTRSPSLDEADLEHSEGPLGSMVFRSVRLPDGRRGRAVSFFFPPKVDDEAKDVFTPQRVRLVVARETAALDSEITFLRSLLAAVTGGTILLALVIGAVVVRQGLRPFGMLASRIATIRQDDLSVRLPTNPIPTEMTPVVDRLNDLLQRLEEAFHRERAFTADAAHELRTPLAGLRSVMEVALARPRSDDDYRQALADCLDIVQHTQAMIDNLLALARLDSGQTTFHLETFRLREVIETAWRPLTREAVAKGISVESHVPTNLECTTDRDNITMTLSILLTNAVEYTNHDGRIQVFAAQVGESLELTLANSGCRLSEEETKHVFERFWRGDASRTNTGIHCGLGLTTAKRIVTSLGGSITASVKEDVFMIRVILPI